MTVTTPGRPATLPVNLDAIPDALKVLPRFVVWRYVEDVDPETREISWDKPPRNARTGGLASSTNERTWCSFADAATAYQRGGLDGIGIVLHRGVAEKHAEGLVGIDLDKCRDPETGTIDPWALKIVRAIDSYTEVSPSGRGLRLFVYGKLPAHGAVRSIREL